MIGIWQKCGNPSFKKVSNFLKIETPIFASYEEAENSILDHFSKRSGTFKFMNYFFQLIVKMLVVILLGGTTGPWLDESSIRLSLSLSHRPDPLNSD